MTHPSSNHKLGKDRFHIGWNNTNEPALRVKPGEVVEFDLMDAGGGQLTPNSNLEDLGKLDFATVNPTVGPVFIEGAQPGDALKVSVLSIRTEGWGWTANIPGFGLLAERFTEPALHIWKFDPDILAPAAYKPGGRVPLKPFPGIMGTAPAESGVHSAVTPLRTGGNMDTRDLAQGAELWLPVAVPGALFSMGDGHAAQGDGEICGTAIECPMKAVIRFDLVKKAGLRFPRFSTPGPVTSHLDRKGYIVTTGVGPDLMQAAREAAADMVDLVAREHGMRDVEAYMLMSVCADLRISEIVDMPHGVVSCYFPKVVFE